MRISGKAKTSAKSTMTIGEHRDQQLKQILTASLGTRRTPRVLSAELLAPPAHLLFPLCAEGDPGGCPVLAVPMVVFDHHPFCYYNNCRIFGVIDTSHNQGFVDGNPIPIPHPRWLMT